MSDPAPVHKARVLGFVLNNIELILTFVGLLVILILPRLFGETNPWTIMALTATIVGVLHGLIFWMVRRRQRQVRQQSIDAVRLMMQDIVKNQLSIILTSTYIVTRNHDDVTYVNRINETVNDISSALDNLSEESLITWQQRYQVDQPTPVGDTRPLGKR